MTVSSVNMMTELRRIARGQSARVPVQIVAQWAAEQIANDAPRRKASREAQRRKARREVRQLERLWKLTAKS